MSITDPSSPPDKKSLIIRLIIIVSVTFTIAELSAVIATMFNSKHAGIIEVLENILEIGFLFLFIYHFVTIPMLKEVTKRIDAENQLRKSESANRAILDALPDTILRVSSDGILIDYRLETECVKNVGIGNHIEYMFPEESVPGIVNCVNNTITNGEINKLEIVIIEDQTKHHQELRFVRSGSDEVLIIISDITDRKINEERLKYVSTHDCLTRLYNRTFYEAQLERFGKGRQFPISIIVIDLDGLKETNDKYGHAAGDRLICKAADVLKLAFRAEDLVARTGGDEFTIIIPETDYNDLQIVVNRITACLDEINKADPKFELRFSLGTAIAETREKFQDAIRMADLRMYEDKAIRKSADQFQGVNRSNKLAISAD